MSTWRTIPPSKWVASSPGYILNFCAYPIYKGLRYKPTKQKKQVTVLPIIIASSKPPCLWDMSGDIPSFIFLLVKCHVPLADNGQDHSYLIVSHSGS